MYKFSKNLTLKICTIAVFMLIQVVGYKLQVNHLANVYAEETSYTQNFDDGNLGGWAPTTSSGETELKVENGKLILKHIGGNKALIVDNNSPDIKNGILEYDVKPISGLRTGVLVRYVDHNNWAYIGYNGVAWTWSSSINGSNKYGNLDGPTLKEEQTYHVKIEINDSDYILFVDGVEYFSGSLSNMLATPGKIGIRQWYGSESVYDNFKYTNVISESEPEPTTPSVLNTIESDDITVTIDEIFPRVDHYTLKSSPEKTLYGQEDTIYGIKINNKLYYPEVSFTKSAANKAEYKLNIKELDVIVDIAIEVNNNILNFDITNVNETGTEMVKSIEIPNHNLISVRSDQSGASFAGSRLVTKVEEHGDTFQSVTGEPTTDATPKNYMYGFINNDELSAGLWTNSVHDASGDDSTRVQKQTVKQGNDPNAYYRTGLWSGSWIYRAKGMNEPEKNLPSTKIVICQDENSDNQVDWQDSAIGFRDIMNNPIGTELVPNMVVQRIAHNFASQATNTFLKVLDETKRVYLYTDGLGQFLMLKGYGSEGHDSGHPDYGNVGQRMGGIDDINKLVDVASNQYNTYTGVHINAHESYPEAKAFNETLVNPNGPGWDWLDTSYVIDTRTDATSGNRIGRLKELKQKVPNLDFIYLDVWYKQGWDGRRIAQEINSQGWALTTEFPNVHEYDAIWYHWSADKKYGGTNLKGYNSKIARFIRNHQKDTWIVQHPLLGGGELSGFEGWGTKVNIDDAMKMVFDTNLPTKYLQHFPITKWEGNTILLENNVSVSEDAGVKEITKDSKTVLKGNTYLLPWELNNNPEGKLYHWNKDGGTTTWDLPNSWADKNGGTVKLYKLTDQGKEHISDLDVTVDGKITIENALASVPYVIYKVASTNPDVKWGEGSYFNDPGFNSDNLDAWSVVGEGASVQRNDRGQYELVIESGNGATVSQEITGLSKGTYSASLYVEVENGAKRRAKIGVKGLGGSDVVNYTDSSIAHNYMNSDTKHSTNMQKMRILFDVPADNQSATIYMEAEAGTGQIKFDELRVVKAQRPEKPQNAYFYEDFENIVEGWYPFVRGAAGGLVGPKTHLSERHEPYTQKGWNGKIVDDVINGNWSLKLHKARYGQTMRTIPQTLRFEPEKTYKISFKYQAAKDKVYKFVLGDGANQIEADDINVATETAVFSKTFKASKSGESWVGFEQSLTYNNNAGDLIIDDFLVEEITSASPLVSPVLTADNQAILGNDVIITFEDNLDWRNAVTSVKVDGTSISTDKYSFAEERLIINESIFSMAKEYSVTVEADKYLNATVKQDITESDKPNDKTFVITHDEGLDRTSGIKTKVNVELISQATSSSVVVFQLMKGNTPINIVALEKDDISDETLIAYFNVPKPQDISYKVKVFVFDRFDSNLSAPVNLADPITLD